MDDIPHDVGYVLGNGPSRDRSKTRYDGVTYGCNSIHTEMDVDHPQKFPRGLRSLHFDLAVFAVRYHLLRGHH